MVNVENPHPLDIIHFIGNSSIHPSYCHRMPIDSQFAMSMYVSLVRSLGNRLMCQCSFAETPSNAVLRVRQSQKTLLHSTIAPMSPTAWVMVVPVASSPFLCILHHRSNPPFSMVFQMVAARRLLLISSTAARISSKSCRGPAFA